MRITYVLLTLLFAVPSALLGFFFLGSAGLAATTTAMSLVLWVWAGGNLLVLAGLTLAIRRGSIGALLGLCCVPLALAVGLAQLALRFGQ